MTLIFRLLFCLMLTLHIHNSAFSAVAEEKENLQEKETFQDFQAYIHYWAFNGETLDNSALIDELIDSAANLSEAIGLGTKENSAKLISLDIAAQKGPQVFLSLKTFSLIQAGLEKQKYAELNRFHGSIKNINQHLGEISGAFLNFMERKPFNLNKDLLLNPTSIKECVQKCVSKFLNLENNKVFQYMIGMNPNRPEPGINTEREMGQIYLKFPFEKKSHEEKFKKRTFDPRVASTGNDTCSSSCFRDVTDYALKVGLAFGSAFLPMSPQAGVAGFVGGMMVGASVGAGKCSLGGDCSRAAHLEATNREKRAEIEAKELALREKQVKDREKERLAREIELKTQEDKLKAENAKKQKEEAEQRQRDAKKAQEEEDRRRKEQHERDVENRLKKFDWADRNKNEDSVNDSSASCVHTRTCDGTMTAFVDKDFVKKPTLTPEEIQKRKERTSTPMPKEGVYKRKPVIIFDNKPEDWEKRGITLRTNMDGRVITNWEISSTPTMSAK